MRARIAVSFDRKTGKTIPAAHCRHAPEGCDKRLSVFAHYLVGAAERHSVDPWLMAAMAFKESGFNPFALGSIGELGILQINPGRRDASQVRFIRDEWYRRRCRKQPGACQEEIVTHAAAVFARSLSKCGGDVIDALGAYNTGRCGGNDRYAKRILAEREELQKAAGLPTGPSS
jgi:soluble lytic murein transglycosylase-like protein